MHAYANNDACNTVQRQSQNDVFFLFFFNSAEIVFALS